MSGIEMIAVNNDSGFQPTQAQRLILRAALLQGDPAIESWKEWRRTVNIDVLDFGSHRLIPQLYRNLIDHGVDDPLRDRFKGVYRYYLYKNEILMHHTSLVLRELAANAIETILLKGCALIPLYYKDSALRPMLDADLLVRVEDAARSMALLKELGYSQAVGLLPTAEGGISARHSVGFSDSEGRQIDLHWHLLWECWHARDIDYWDRTRPLLFRDLACKTLGPTDQLLHICWHGNRWNEVPPIRWIADAMVLLNQAEKEIDWDLLVAKAGRHRISLSLMDALLLLKSSLDAPVPDNVIESLKRIPVSRLSRIGYGANTTPLAPKSTTKLLSLLLFDYLWLMSSTTMRPKTLGYLKFLQGKWRIKHLWLVPLTLVFRSVKWIFTSFGRIRVKNRKPRSEQQNADEISLTRVT